MKISIPIYRLKQRARQIARAQKVPHHAALDQVARAEGFRSWSHLAAHHAAQDTASRLHRALTPGELVLVGARPRQGKTQLCVEVCIAAMRAGHNAWFFSLDFTAAQVAACFTAVGADHAEFTNDFCFDNSEEICADYMCDQLSHAPAGSIVVIDYLQSLDTPRRHSELQVQVQALRTHAQSRSLNLLFIAQISRRFGDGGEQGLPGRQDVYLPNPLDLDVFDQHWFMGNGELETSRAA